MASAKENKQNNSSKRPHKEPQHKTQKGRKPRETTSSVKNHGDDKGARDEIARKVVKQVSEKRQERHEKTLNANSSIGGSKEEERKKIIEKKVKSGSKKAAQNTELVRKTTKNGHVVQKSTAAVNNSNKRTAQANVKRETKKGVKDIEAKKDAVISKNKVTREATTSANSTTSNSTLKDEGSKKDQGVNHSGSGKLKDSVNRTGPSAELKETKNNERNQPGMPTSSAAKHKESSTPETGLQQEMEDLNELQQQEPVKFLGEDCSKFPSKECVYKRKDKTRGEKSKQGVVEKVLVYVAKRMRPRKKKAPTNVSVSSITEFNELSESAIATNQAAPVQNKKETSQNYTSQKKTTETESIVVEKKMSSNNISRKAALNSKGAHDNNRVVTNKVKTSEIRQKNEKNETQNVSRKNGNYVATTSEIQGSNNSGRVHYWNDAQKTTKAHNIIRNPKGKAVKGGGEACATKLNITISSHHSLFLSEASYEAELTEESSSSTASDFDGFYIARENPIVKRDTLYEPHCQV